MILMQILIAITAMFSTINSSLFRNTRVRTSIDSSSIQGVVEAASRDLMPYFYNQDLKTRRKMDLLLSIFEEERIDASAFHGVDGYGYGDLGREKLDRVVANLMGAEEAMVRIQIFSGTHAIFLSALWGYYGQEIPWQVSGHPYDTLEEVIGLRQGSQTGSLTGSLKDWVLAIEVN